MAMDGAKVCDVGRVLVIEASLICFFRYVRKKDISKGRVWEGEERKGRQSEGRMTLEGAKVCDVGRVVLGTIVLGQLVLGQFV